MTGKIDMAQGVVDQMLINRSNMQAHGKSADVATKELDGDLRNKHLPGLVGSSD